MIKFIKENNEKLYLLENNISKIETCGKFIHIFIKDSVIPEYVPNTEVNLMQIDDELRFNGSILYNLAINTKVDYAGKPIDTDMGIS